MSADDAPQAFDVVWFQLDPHIRLAAVQPVGGLAVLDDDALVALQQRAVQLVHHVMGGAGLGMGTWVVLAWAWAHGGVHARRWVGGLLCCRAVVIAVLVTA